MSVQDDRREQELCRAFGLHWDQEHDRGGDDATLQVTVDGVRYEFTVEVKSTTKSSVSTARDVSMQHIERWRARLFVVGYYNITAKGPRLSRLLCLTPVDMKPWIDKLAAKVEPDYKLGLLAARRLELEDLFDVCGRKELYTMADAKQLHKSQWTVQQYRAAADNEGHLYSPQAMLRVLRARAAYIADRGATLNNPHITSTHLDRFAGTDRETTAADAAATIRSIAASFVRAHPDGHPAFRHLPDAFQN